jgi:hypothetical protein
MPTLIAVQNECSGCTASVATLHEAFERVVQRDEAAADAGGAGAAVGLQHVAVDHHLALAERPHVARRSQRPPDQALDLHGAPALLAARRLTVDPLRRRARQHRVLGGHPALAGVAHPARHVVVDRGGAQHPRLAERHQHEPSAISVKSRSKVMGRSSSSVRPSGRAMGSPFVVGGVGGCPSGTRWPRSGGWGFHDSVWSSSGPEQLPAELAEQLHVATRHEPVAPDTVGVAHEAELAEAVHHGERGLVGGAHQRDLGTHHLADRAREERVVGAAEQQRVDAASRTGANSRSASSVTSSPVGLAALDELDEARTGRAP